MTPQKPQQTGQPFQVVNEQDLAAVVGGMMVSTRREHVLTLQETQQISRNPLGIGPVVQDVSDRPHPAKW